MVELRAGTKTYFDSRRVADALLEIGIPTTTNARGELRIADNVRAPERLDPEVLERLRAKLPDGFLELIDNDLAGLLLRRGGSLPGRGNDLGLLGSRSFSSALVPTTFNALAATAADATPREIRRAETWLKRLGYDPGTIDGRLSAKSRRAIARFQAALGLPETTPPGELTDQTLRRLEAAANRVRKHGPGYLTPGMAGTRVRKLQQRLRRLGDYQGAVTGVYDQETVDAVRSFRARHPDLKNGVKSWGKKAQRVLNKELENIAHDPYRRRVKGSAQQRRLDARAREIAANGGIGPDSPRSVIAHVQRQLRAAGYHPNRVDGVWDDHTAAMVHQFQRRSGLPETQRIGPNTWSRLARSTIEAKGRFDPKQNIGERSNAVLRTERRLKKAGYNPGKVDGYYTAATERAVDQLRRHFGRSAKNDGVNAATDRLITRRIKQRNSFRKPIDFRLTASSEFLVPDAEGAPSARGGRYHAAKDWFAPGGTKVRSPIAGRIVEVRPSRGNSGQVFGGTVKVQGKDGKVWVFRHVNPANVRVGQRVSAGKVIARVTNWADGPDHAHVELWKTLSGGYRLENMIDPMRYLRRFL